jgi:hypothetical protein
MIKSIGKNEAVHIRSITHSEIAMKNAFKIQWILGVLIFFKLSIVVNADPTSIPSSFDKNVVQFIFQKDASTNYQPAGTCFVVEVKKIHIPKIFIPIPFIGKPTMYYMARYFVTCKHVLFDESGSLRQNLYLRVGNKDGGITYMALSDEINRKTLRVLAPDDTNVDLAIVCGAVPSPDQLRSAKTSPREFKNDDIQKYKLSALNSSLVIDKNSYSLNGITEGYEMFFVGLFVPFFGSGENIPVFRFGHLAMLPDEKISLGNGRNPYDLFLMEAEAFPGNSGSPAFFTRKRSPIDLWFHQLFTKDPSESKIMLAGVVDAYFKDFSPVLTPYPNLQAVSTSNTGIAVIVPASYIYEILFSEEEKSARDLEFKEYRPSGYF